MEPPAGEPTTLARGGVGPSTAAEELRLAGRRVDGPAAFVALSQEANLRSLTLSQVTFSDAGWDGLVAAVRECPRVNGLSLVGCGLGPQHATDLAVVHSADGCTIETLQLSQNPIIGLDKRGRGTVDLSGFSALCKAIPSSKITSLDFAECGLNLEAVAL
eukprot:COSAG02_NODE_10487_length_1931_cov_1.963428_1_plen_159_part_10